MSIFAFHPKLVQLLINQLIALILTALSGCSLVQKNTSVCVLGILYKVHIGSNHDGSSKPAQLRVLRKRNSSGKASSDAGPELAGRAAERRWKARRP